MDNGKSLYKQLSSDKLYTKSYDEFVKQYGNPEGQKKLFNQLSSDNLYSKSEGEFVKQYWGAPVKKKDQPQLAKPTTSVSKSVSAPTKPLSVAPLKNPEVPEEVGYVEDLWNRFKGSSTKVLSAFLNVPSAAQSYVYDVALAATGRDEEFNRLPAAAKKEVKNAVRAINKRLPNGEFQYQTQQAANYLNKKAETIYQRTIKDETSLSDEIGKLATNPTTEGVLKIVNKSIRSAVESAPYMGVSMIPGGAAVIGVATAAEKREQELEDTGEYGMGYLINSAVTGGSNYLGEKYTGRILNKIGAKAIGNPELLKKVTQAPLVEVAKDLGIEFSTEFLQTFTQEVSDKLTKGQEVDWVPTLKKALDDGLIGAGSIGAVTGIGSGTGKLTAPLKRYLATKIIAKEDASYIEKGIDAIKDLNTQKADDQDPIVNEAIDNKIEEIKTNITGKLQTAEDTIDNMSEEDIKKVVQLDRDIVDVNLKAQAINDNSNLDEPTKKLFLDDLKKQYINLKQQKDAIQKQATSQVPVQPEAGVGGEVAQGESKAEPQVTAEETKKQKIAEIKDRRDEAMMAITNEAESMTDEERKNAALEILDRRIKVYDKFDAEIAALDQPATQEVKVEEVKKALEDLKKAPSVKYWMQPDFSSESIGQPKNDEPNGFSYDMVDTSEGKATIINTYDAEGKIAATMSILDVPSGDSPKGAFKISTREGAQKQGYASMLLDEASRMGYDIPSLIKNNSFSESGRNLLRSWLNKKLEVPAEETKKQKIAEIEKRMQQEMMSVSKEAESMTEEERGNTALDRVRKRAEITAKYDAELAALEQPAPSETKVEEVKPSAGGMIQMAETQPTTEEVKVEEIERRRKEELDPYASQTTVSEETFEGLDLEGNPVVYVVRTKADGSREVRLQLTKDGKVETFPIGKASKDITFSNAELIEKSYASEPKSISINNTPNNPKKINDINAKYDAELAALEQPTTEEVKVEEVAPTEEVTPTEPITPQQKTEQTTAVQKGIDAVNKALKRGRPKKEAVQGGISYMQQTVAYEQANDVTREQMLRDINKEFGVKEKKAPSVKKVMGTPAPTKVTVNETTALKDQIKLEAKAAKGGADFVKKITKSVGDMLKSMVKSGSITPFQQKIIFNGLKSNLTNPTILDRFLGRVDRVMRIADYNEKVRQANSVKSKLATAAKRKGLKPELKDIAEALSKVQPSMLDNLQDYIDKAKEALAAMSSTKLVNGEVKESTLIDFKDFTKYAEKLLKNQNDAIEQDKIQEYENLKKSGVISGDMSLAEMEAYLKEAEQKVNFEENLEKEKTLAEYAKESFANSKETVQEMIDEGEVSEEDLPLIKGFMNINTDDMNPKMAVKAADELRNYIHNGSKTGMGKILSEYLGAAYAKGMAKKINVSKILSVGGIKNLILKGIDAATGFAMGIVKLPGTNFSGWYSDSWLEYVSQIDNVGVTAMGEKNWKIFRELSGFDKIVTGFIRNQKQIDVFIKNFVKKYEKKKVDGYNVFTNYNANQAGMIADFYREVGSTPEEVNENFKDRKEILGQYLDYMKGKVRYKFEYDMIKGLYDKLGIEKATSGQEIFDNAPKLMQDVVNDMINEWSDGYYPNAKRVAEEQYGILLGQNKNYTPYRWKVVSNKISSTDHLYDKGGYVSDFDILSTEEAGTFKKVSRVKNLPTINGEVVRVPSYNFFQNNIDALTQTGNNINTIAGINQFSGFTKSPYYKEIIKDDDSRNLLTKRMIYNISKLTDRERISTDKFTRGLLKMLNVFSGLGTRLGLGALTAGGTQALPALTNTLVNLEMNPIQMLRATRMILNPSDREWLNNLDETITNRGAESTTSLDYAQKIFANKDFGAAGDVVKGIADLTKVYVDYSLVKSDVAAAKISWLAYYLTELEKKGVDVSNIKLSETEVDKDAAKIAERKVQKEQNVNISELSGKLFSSKSVGLRALRMSLLAFQSYTISSRDKIKTNMSILFNPSSLSTVEEKMEAMNSIAATIAEQIVFSKIKAGVRNIVIGGAFAALGEEESEEERKLREKRNQENSELNIFQALTGSFGLGDQEWDLDIINSVLDYFEGTIDQQEVERRILEQEEKDLMDEEVDSEFTVRLTPEEKKAERLQRSLDRPFRFYVPKLDSDDEGAKYASYLGSGKVLYDVITKVVKETDDDIKRGGYYDKRGNFIEYNEEQLNKLKMLRNVAPAQLIGLTPSEVKTLTNEMKKIMKDRAYLNKMEAKDEEKRAKSDN